MFNLRSARLLTFSKIAVHHYATTKTATGLSSIALKLGGGVAKKGAVITTSIQQYVEAEADPKKLVNYCCGLNYKKNQEPIEIKPDSEYPNWLYGLEKLDQIDIDQLDKDTWEYWIKYNQQGEEYLRMTNEKRFPERYIPTWLKEIRPLY